uniref:Uncharacterized protein n=1 Tax=Bracon brevicornis TaxID=1563983 RepID=A0A6V7HY14_9HYME
MMGLRRYVVKEGDSRYVPQLDRTKGGLAGDIIITNQRACHGLGGVQACVLLLTTQQTRHNHISTQDTGRKCSTN